MVEILKQMLIFLSTAQMTQIKGKPLELNQRSLLLQNYATIVETFLYGSMVSMTLRIRECIDN